MHGTFGTMNIMDRTGHSTVTWNPTDPSSVKDAEAKFKEMIDEAVAVEAWNTRSPVAGAEVGVREALREFVEAYKLQDCDNFTAELARAYSLADAALALPVAERDGGGAATELEYLEDNIATVAWHLGRPGARIRVENDMCGLVVDPGEVLVEISRRLTRHAQGPMWAWLPVDHRPLKTGTYLVGHRGHQEIMKFFGPEIEWRPGTQMGWLRLTKQGWERDDPAERFKATHCVMIETPPAHALHVPLPHRGEK